ncbi:MAG: hypothetical protein GY757_16820 [bacterium]|nr:hypothetical protein [bacterium]
MIRRIDMTLKPGKGQGFYFLTGLLQMLAITGGFYLASRISVTAVIYYIVGLSVIIAAIMGEVVYRLFRSV